MPSSPRPTRYEPDPCLYDPGGDDEDEFEHPGGEACLGWAPQEPASLDRGFDKLSDVIRGEVRRE